MFGDPLAGIIFDPKHSQDENRYIIVGESEQRRLLVVSFVERGANIRIISTRKATSKEKRDYERKDA